MVYFFVPYVSMSFRNGEVSNNAGGLIIWPAKAILLVGFVLLGLQGISEIIKKIAMITGDIDDPAPFVPTHPPIEVDTETRSRGHDRVHRRRTWRRSCSPR